MPSQAGLRGDPIITIGDRCTLGKGIGIVGHERIEIGDDIWTGHYVYVTDQNHGYEDVDLPIGAQMWKNEPVSIGDGSWLGHGAIVLPGSRIGRARRDRGGRGRRRHRRARLLRGRGRSGARRAPVRRGGGLGRPSPATRLTRASSYCSRGRGVRRAPAPSCGISSGGTLLAS